MATELSKTEEQKFQRWFQSWVDRGIADRDPDTPVYDYRAAYLAGAEPEMSEGKTKQLHWPSEFKAEDHPNRYVTDAEENPGIIVGGGMLDSKTGKPVSRNRQPQILREKMKRSE